MSYRKLLMRFVLAKIETCTGEVQSVSAFRWRCRSMEKGASENTITKCFLSVKLGFCNMVSQSCHLVVPAGTDHYRDTYLITVN